VPDPAYPPKFEDEIVLSGDGMVSKFAIRDGKVNFAIRYVETARYKAEKAAGRALFGKYRNPFTDDAEVQGIEGTVSNTTPVWHAGRLFMTKEDGLAYEIDPETLATIGRWDYHGALKSKTFTAHPRVDAETGRCSSSATRPAACARRTWPIASPTRTATWCRSSGSSNPIVRRSMTSRSPRNTPSSRSFRPRRTSTA
jgi:carotenoid cleavage dioxygenase-like enzyme